VELSRVEVKVLSWWVARFAVWLVSPSTSVRDNIYRGILEDLYAELPYNNANTTDDAEQHQVP
jgi:hypothetical protein